MSAHGLGLDDATKALAVSKALQREMEAREISVIDAVDDLTSKLSLANLFRMNSSSAIEPAVTDSATKTRTSTAPCDDLVSVRIQPVAALAGLTRAKQTATPSTNTSPSTAPPFSGRKTRASNKHNNNKQKVATACNNRKRSADDMTATKNNAELGGNNNGKKKEDTQQTVVKRERSDSLSEVVNAKFADKKKEDNTSSTTGRMAAANRSKRGRAEEVEAVATSQNGINKRTRTTAGDN